MIRSPILLVLLGTLGALLLVPGLASAASYSNTDPFTMRIDRHEATPFPSEITVDGERGPISRVFVTLHKFGHTEPQDVDVLLVSPTGIKIVLVSDACGGDTIEDYTWTFSSSATNRIPQTSDCGDLTYAPADYEGDEDTWPGAPAGADAASLRPLLGQDPNGTWRLYVRDDRLQDGGDIEGGWSLGIDTAPVDATVPASGTAGPSSSYPAVRTVSGRTGLLRDVEVGLEGVSHERPEDLEVLVVGPQGQKVILMADTCGGAPLLDASWIWLEGGEAMPSGPGGCTGQFRPFRPTGNADASLPAPAPPGPYATSLSAFNFTDPNGEWKLFIADDSPGAIGWIAKPFALTLTTRAPSPVRFKEPAATLAEGSAGLVTLQRTGNAPYGAATITVRTAAESATAGSDFLPVDTKVQFAAGEQEKTIAFATLPDAEFEPDETFALTLTDPSGDAALPNSPDDPSRVTVTIPGQAAPDTPPGADSPRPDPVVIPLATDRTSPVVTVTPGSRVARDGTVRTRVRCSEACSGRVTLVSSRRLKVGAASFRLARAGSTTVKVKLTARARKALRVAKRIRVTTTATATDGAANRGAGTAKGTLR